MALGSGSGLGFWFGFGLVTVGMTKYNPIIELHSIVHCWIPVSTIRVGVRVKVRVRARVGFRVGLGLRLRLRLVLNPSQYSLRFYVDFLEVKRALYASHQ